MTTDIRPGFQLPTSSSPRASSAWRPRCASSPTPSSRPRLRVRPQARDPCGIIAEMGERGAVALTFPEEYGGQGGNYRGPLHRDRGRSRASTQSLAVTLGGRYRSRRRLDPALRHRRSRRTAGCPISRPAAPSRASVSPRPDAGLGRRRHEDHGRARGWRVGHQRQRSSSSRTRARDITSLVTVTAGHRSSPDGRPELSCIIVPVGHARVRGRPVLRQDWLAHFRHRIRSFTDDAPCRRRTCWAEARPRLREHFLDAPG